MATDIYIYIYIYWGGGVGGLRVFRLPLWLCRHPCFCSRSWTGSSNRPSHFAPESTGIFVFCSTYKLKRPLAVLGYSTRPGRDVENGGRSHFVNIEFRGGRIAKNEVPGCHNSGPETRFRASKKRSFGKMESLK